jgi:hypothetical protein
MLETKSSFSLEMLTVGLMGLALLKVVGGGAGEEAVT